MSFYFFDLETSGFRSREDRIMQFAGQRTDMGLNPIGEPDNILIKLNEDVLPQPDAILVTGITPQATLAEGITEAEFCKYFMEQVATPGTILVGFNSIRFDNEFIRFILWRNFYVAYEWGWKDDRSIWDLLDVVRMTRALRPDGIKWPFASDGKPANRLELLSAVNKLEHANAHDALSDVNATIDVARLIKTKQPKLFDYLLKNRGKNQIAPLVTAGQPLVYTSGRYPAEWEKTTVAVMVAAHPDKNAALMYDLRIDPEQYAGMTPKELAKLWSYKPARNMQTSGVQGGGEQAKEAVQNGTANEPAQPATTQSVARTDRVAGSASKQAGSMHDAEYFPVKVLSYNRCPAIAPYITLDKASEDRLDLHKDIIENHFKKLQKLPDLGDKLVEALRIVGEKYKDQQGLIVDETKVDSALYDGFINDADKTKMRVVRAADANGLADLHLDFADERLKCLLPLYKARNYPKSLNDDEQQWWEGFKQQKLTGGNDKSAAANYFRRLDELAGQPTLSAEQKYLLGELRLYGESILPAG